MRPSLRILPVLFFAGPFSITIFAQGEYEPFRTDTSFQVHPEGNLAAIVFDKNLSTYHWNAFVNLNKTFGPFSLNLNEQFHSTLIQITRKLIRDEQTLDMRARHQWLGRVSGILRANSFMLSDDQKFTDGQRPGVTSASSNGFYGGIETELFDNVFIEPLAGIRYDNQVGIRDNGFSLIVDTWSPGLQFDGYHTTFAGRFQRDVLHPRILQKWADTLRIGKTFFQQTRNTLQASYTANQRDFYFPADTNVVREFNVTNNIERRIERVIAFGDTLQYNIGERFLLSAQGTIASRQVDRLIQYRPRSVLSSNSLFNTSVEEFRIGGAVQLAYTVRDDIAAAIEFLVHERDERHSADVVDRVRDEARKDNLSRQALLGSTLNIALSRSDRVLLAGAATLLRYDTPSVENVEDRDELWYAFNLTTLHQLNSYLHLRIVADVNLTHLVYIDSLRSANNSWNRIFRLAPRLYYIPSRDFWTANTFEVLANYTVYDFENNPAVQVKSFSFRQFAFVDTTRLTFSSHVALEGIANVRLYQRGELRWDAFKERPLNYFEDKTFIGRVECATEQRLLFSVGIRYFSQVRFSYVAGTRVFESILKSIGPLAGFQWQVGERSQLIIDGWYERQTQTAVPPRGFANMTMSLNLLL